MKHERYSCLPSLNGTNPFESVTKPLYKILKILMILQGLILILDFVAVRINVDDH